MSARAAGALLGALGFLLAACEPMDTKRPPLPTLDRPLLALDQPLREHGAVMIPRSALIERAGVAGVFVRREGRARFRVVKPGRERGRSIEILSGLHGDETLVLGDFAAVHDGSPINPVQSEK